MQPVTQYLKSAIETRRLRQSGLFDAGAYLRCNDDLEYTAFRATVHYCRHGRFENRETGQDPVSRWLTPVVIKGRVSAAAVRDLLSAVPRGCDAAPAENVIDDFSRDHGLIAEEFWFHFYQARQEYDAAHERLDRLPMEAAFLHHYASARRHLRLDRLREAHRWSLEAMERPGGQPVEFYVAAREIADAVGFEACPELDFHRRLVHAFSEKAVVTPARKWAALWQVGYPYIPDGSDAAAAVRACLPEGLRGMLPASIGEVYSTAAGWGPVLNALSLNQLTGQAHLVQWTGGVWRPPAAGMAGEALTVRVPGEGYWRLAQTPGTHALLLSGFRCAARAAGEVGMPVLPRPATLIFDVRGPAGRPTLSYHTISNPDQNYLNYKESALPGYFQFDRTGYSGWASGTGATPPAEADQPAADAFFDTLREKYVDGRVTKYAQAMPETDLPGGQFILVALQVPDDTVSALAHMSVEDMVAATADQAAQTGARVVIKRHPLDRSGAMGTRLEALIAAHGNVTLSEAPIFDLVRQAECVVTVNSGVGLEALLYLKPVITTGASDYGACTIEARTPDELKAALAELEQGLPAHLEPDALKRWLHQYFTQCCFTPDTVPQSFLDALHALRAGGEGG